MNLLRLFYISKARPGLGRADVTDILAASRRNNAAAQVTGVLCYAGGYFGQILEGEERTVLGLYLKIADDPRHEPPVIVTISTEESRAFGSWSMGWVPETTANRANLADVVKLRRSGREHAGAALLMQEWLQSVQAGTP
jgi:hypothetical protein